MSIFYEIIPVDTLFFNGSTPMTAGQNAAVSLFPPPVSVFEGAVRTTVLLQKNINLQNYASGKDESLVNLIGKAGEEAPFKIDSFMIKKDGRFYVQAPQTWYFDTDSAIKTKKNYLNQKIIQTKDFQKEFEALSVMSSEKNIPFARAEKKLVPLKNIWISLNFLKSKNNVLGEEDFLLQNEIFTFEQRTGVALDSKKHTVEGQLYSSSHIRLNDDVSLAFSISKDAGLLPEGKIFLGGERRICKYKKIDLTLLEDFKFDSSNFLSLTAIEASEENLKSLIASSKLITSAGWDLKTGFHKPTKSYIPAGAVFSKNIGNFCIPLLQK